MADKYGQLDYNDWLERGSDRMLRAIQREHSRMDARPPFIEYARDVLQNFLDEYGPTLQGTPQPTPTVGEDETPF